MRHIAGKAFEVGTWLVMAAVLLQILLAGLGVFADPGFFFWHGAVNSIVVAFLPLVIVLAGRLGRVPGRILGLAAAVFGLTVLQSLLLIPYHMTTAVPLRAVSALHVLNALVIVWVALTLVTRTRGWARGGRGAPTLS